MTKTSISWVILNKKKLLGIFDAKKQMNKAVKQEEKERRNVGEGQPLTTTLFNINPSPPLLFFSFAFSRAVGDLYYFLLPKTNDTKPSAFSATWALII